jgi:phospholipid N-methyltransferase
VSHEPQHARVADADLIERERRSDFLIFARKFARKGTAIAAIGPSGSLMCNAMTRHIDFSKPGVIVEIGAGTGAITREITRNLRPHHRFISVEIDDDFAEILQSRFPQVEVIRGDATNLEEPLRRLGVQRVQYVFSGLATPHLPLRGQIGLHRWLHRMLDPSGTYMQITFVPRIYHGYYQRHFRHVHYTPIWRNIPPGGVFTCRHIREFVVPKRHRKLDLIKA